MLRPDPRLTMKESRPPASCREGTSNGSSEQRPHQLWLPPAYPPSEDGEGNPALLNTSSSNHPLPGLVSTWRAGSS